MIDYKQCVKVIQAKAKCSADEAWTGLASAYLTLDTSRTEREQVLYLQTVGTYAVHDYVRSKYTDRTSGIIRMVTADFADIPSASATSEDFLKVFPDGLVREFATGLADGASKFTIGSASHWLRNCHNINNRKLPREVLNDTRSHAKRLLKLDGILFR